MPTTTTHYALALYNASTDEPQNYSDYRQAQSGTPSGSNMNLIDTALYNIQVLIDNLPRGVIYVNALSGGTNSYVATGVTGASILYYIGETILVNFNVANTGDSTLNINGLGAKSLYKTSSSGATIPLVANDLYPSRIYLFVYDGYKWMMVGSSSSGSSDGWTEDSNTWVYASASTFTVTGDKTAIFAKDTKLKYTQSSTVRYATVLSSSFSTDTTVTIAVNNDYVIDNSAITLGYVSYLGSPAGWPEWFNYTPTMGGFSSDPTDAVYRYSINKGTIKLAIAQVTAGTSNDTIFTISLPVQAKTLSNASWISIGKVYDNGTPPVNPGELYVSSGATDLYIYPDFGGGLFTASGDKRLKTGNIEYEY